MSGYNLRYSPDALRDLDHIWDSMLSDFGDPEAAAKTVNDILDAIEKLNSFPRMGAALSSITDVASDYRFLVAGRYMSFYRVGEANIYIDRILYGKRDYFRILFGTQNGAS